MVKEMQAKVEEVAKLTRRMTKIEESLEKANVRFFKFNYFKASNYLQTKFQEVSANVLKLEKQLDDMGNIQHLDDRRKELNDLIKANKLKIAEFLVIYSSSMR